MPDPPLTIRFARRYRMLIAERDGSAIAAMALSSGALIAGTDPPTARALRRRRYQLLRQGGDVRPVWALPSV